MGQPWKKGNGWPYSGSRGKVWQLGYRDHEGRVRTKHFKLQAQALEWRRQYVQAERQDRLREFLLDLTVATPHPSTVTLAEMLLDWLATDAHPEAVGGLAPNTWDSYRSIASRHILGNPKTRLMKKTGEIVEIEPAIAPLGDGYAIGHLPVVNFEGDEILKKWINAMRKSGVSPQTEARAWKVLSSALSWAASEDGWPIQINGCLNMQRRRGMRRASRRQGTGAIRHTSAGKRRDDLASWALSPLAVERIRAVMLERVDQRTPVLVARDAMVVSVQYGLAMRNQDVWGLRIGDVSTKRARVKEVLSYGALDHGKTEGATGPERRPPIDDLLAEDLAAWKALLAKSGYPVGAKAFLLRGDLGGAPSPDGHMTGSQAHSWPRKFFTPAVQTVAKRWPDEHGDIIGATPYSLRRGMISLRIRAGEDRQAIARQCGTSVDMLERNYSFVIEDLEDEGPRPAAEERKHARQIAEQDRLS